MFKPILSKYQNHGSFRFKCSRSMVQNCNAPDNRSGIYLIYKVEKDENRTLLYIGSSGQRNKDGTLKTRKGGLKDRLINGYHPNRFGLDKRIKRKIALPLQMKKEKIDSLEIEWWVTYDEYNKDFPTDVEKNLASKYIGKKGFKPIWHK